ncbi:MAG TPA: acyl-CoA dehydrogenase family protein, partial [Dehalococcoidales bacterium]|nr:acyl-CoA dehydrogenase family protein [Dehalococcoidales bacterium]
MDFGLNEQQEMLQKSAREFLSDVYSDKILAQMAKEPRGYSDDMWNKMSELGWMALSISEEYGGIGDFLDLTLVLKEMGRAGFISPYFSTMVLGASLLTEAGSPEQKQKHLSAISEGRQKVTLAWNEEPADYSAAAIKTPIKTAGENFIISGRKLLVPDAGSADYLICAFRTSQQISSEEGVTLFIIDAKTKGITCNPLDTISPDKYDEVIFDQVIVKPHSVLGEIGQGWPVLQKVFDKAAAAACSVMLGGEERVLDLTVTYAKDRTAFGHPIG